MTKPRRPGWHGFARLVQRLRWPLLVAWLGAAVAAVAYLPTIESAGGGALGALIPRDAEATKAELRSKTEFGFPLLSRTLLVERDPDGLTPRQQLASVQRAVRLSRGEVPGLRDVRGAIPVSNTLGAPPFSRERSTTFLTYLFINPELNLVERRLLTERLVSTIGASAERPAFVGVTGQAPARAEQANIVKGRLPLIELATVVLVALAVGVRLGAVGAPLLTIAAVAVAYLVSSRAVAWVGQQAGFAVPQEVEPVMVVLVFGVVTDYSVFFIGRFRSLLGAGVERREAAETATAELTPIVFTAGITVVAGTSALLIADLEFLRVFGPGLAFSVLASVVVSLTFIPAGLGAFGGALFWPRRPLRRREKAPRLRRFSAARLATEHPWATLLACTLILGAGASGLAMLKLSSPVIRGLPPGTPERVAYEQASQGFAPGILSPTVIVVSKPGISDDRPELRRLQERLDAQRGVALVVGPAQQPVRGERLGATFAKNGDAVRLFVVLGADPLGARAIGHVRRIKERMPALLEQVGLSGATAMFAGDTALSAETIDKTVDDLAHVAPVAVAAIFLILAIFLRALVAPLYLVAASIAAFAAALGLGALFFQGLLDFEGITYFVPFASAVLLVSLGSDYNVFLIGRIWQQARTQPLREAVPATAAGAARSITLAGVVLAGSFALLALIPVRSFYELAFVMTVGLLIDTFLVRTLLVPALIMLIGPRSGWPGRTLFSASRPAPLP